MGPVTAGRKRGNPDFVSSSFYVPKQVNIRFDRALLTLKSYGFEVDRSDVLAVLMDRFAIAVDAAEQQSDESGLDLEAILASASETLLEETAWTSVLRQTLVKQVKLVTRTADGGATGTSLRPHTDDAKAASLREKFLKQQQGDGSSAQLE